MTRTFTARLAALSLLATGVALAVAALPSRPARAELLDPVVMRRLRVGASRALAPSDRIDARRTGRVATRLPTAPAEVWKRQLGAGIDFAPVVRADGTAVVALQNGDVVSLAPDGTEMWRARLGGGQPMSGPVLLADDSVVVLGGGAQVVGLAPDGSPRFSVSPGIRAARDEAVLLPLEDGGFLLGSGRTVLELGADGSLRARASLPERVAGAFVIGPEGPLCTGEQGGVFLLTRPLAPRRLGDLGGLPRGGAVLGDARTLFAVVDARRLVSLDLPTGSAQTRVGAGSAGAFLDGPPAALGEGRALTATFSGMLFSLDSGGTETVHAILEKPSGTPPADAGASALAAFLGTVELRPSPPVIVDRQGNVGFARASGRVGVVSQGGAVGIASERLCGVPIAVAPAGDRRMIVVCRDGGSVFMLGE
jgi:hypothetical protein